MAPSGMEMMMKSLVKMLGLDPAMIQAHIEEIGKAVHTLAANSEIIRRQNSAIMAHLGIVEPATLTNGLDHAERTEPGSGSGAD